MSAQTDPTTLDYLTGIAAVVTPILLLGLSAIGWKIKNNADRKAELEDKLRDDQVDIYLKILAPLFMVFTPDEAWVEDPEWGKQDKFAVVRRILLSQDYKTASFRLGLIGTDSSVKAYNNLMQHFYNQELAANATEQQTKNNIKEMLSLLGEFLLQVRKSMGNSETALTNWDMIDGWVKDARELRD